MSNKLNNDGSLWASSIMEASPLTEKDYSIKILIQLFGLVHFVLNASINNNSFERNLMVQIRIIGWISHFN